MSKRPETVSRTARINIVDSDIGCRRVANLMLPCDNVTLDQES